MRKTFYLFILLICQTTITVFSKEGGEPSLEYIWPTDASKYLTSVFCEYRPRRFHAGIDIKTWGRVGYKVFAIRPGYVWRISVSPYGYGKAVYLKLDTGEIAVFAHLSKFSEKIQRVMETEQQRLRKYRINKYLKPGVLPVALGEVIAYTGQTGIGAPHLHFEIRDSGNRPMNPLSKGFQIPDHLSPVIKAISISPLDLHSEINGDFKPVIISPKFIREGEYILTEPVTIWGNVGLAISCYDISSRLSNRNGIYSLKLFIDKEERFQYRYDKFSFQNNKMVELERDYRLARRGFGLFYKLYKEKQNTLVNYFPNEPFAGVIKSAPLDAIPTFQSKVILKNLVYKKKANSRGEPRMSHDLNFQTGSLFPGLHEFKIEVADYFGNVSTVTGQLQVGATFDIQPMIHEDSMGTITINNMLTYNMETIKELKVYFFNGKQWQPIDIEWLDYGSEKGGQAPISELDSWIGEISLNHHSINSSVLKFVARDQFGTPSYPFFYIRPENTGNNSSTNVNIDYDFYDDYLRLEINTDSILSEIPKVIVNPGRSDLVIVKIYPKNLYQYIGRIELDDISGKPCLINIIVKNLSGQEFRVSEEFNLTKITPEKIRRITSQDHNFWVNFWLSSLYKPIYGQISFDTLSVQQENNILSRIYEVEPNDVPLKAGAIVHLRYPQDELMPEKLGVYTQKNNNGRWVFIDNNINWESRSIWAKVNSLQRFALIRDEVSPEITQIMPSHKQHITTQTPRISAHVRDRLSGIGSENDVIIRLDGRKVIAEYDPERHRIFYQIKKTLSKGRHEIRVWAQDNSKNETLKKTEFWIE